VELTAELLQPLIAEGLSQKRIADTLGCPVWTVERRLKALGLRTTRDRPARVDLQRKEVARLVAEGASTREIAAQLKTSQSNVRYWLRRYELTTSPRRRERQLRQCFVCQTVIVRGKFCGRGCLLEADHRRRVERWLAGQPLGASGGIPAFVRRHLYETRGERCERCGWAERHPLTGRIPLEIDHIDGDRTNGRPDNLKILCPSCHALTSTFRTLNKKLTSRRGAVVAQLPHNEQVGGSSPPAGTILVAS
jgi:DNA-binding CsgD family transcriptional regulator